MSVRTIFLTACSSDWSLYSKEPEPNNKKLFSFQLQLNPNFPRKFFTVSGNLGTEMATGLQPMWIQCCKMFLSFSFSYILFSWRTQKSISLMLKQLGMPFIVFKVSELHIYDYLKHIQRKMGKMFSLFPYICWYQYIVRFCLIFLLHIAASIFFFFHFYFYCWEKCHFLPVLKVDKVKLQ